MDAPVQFFRKNTNTSPGIPAWPFALFGDGAPLPDGIELGSSGPYWVGDWQTPPPEVCDILTASEWQIQFQCDPSEIGGSYSDIPPVSLDTTIKPGQIKRKTEIDGEYVIGGDGYQSLLDIIDKNFEGSEEYDESLLDGEFFRLQYEWTSPVIEDGEEIDGLFSVVRLTISPFKPTIGKNEDDEWVWFFFAQAGAPGLVSYSVAFVEYGIEGSPIGGNVINFMENQHDDPVTGFPVVSLSIVSHFGED